MSRVITVLGVCFVLGTAVYSSSAAPRAAAQATRPSDGLAAKVKAQIEAEPELKNHSINVTASNDTVTLEGEVPSVVARAKAGELAMKTEGVKKVKNKLKLANAE
jgi:osmotically-inducible protein OsmY